MVIATLGEVVAVYRARAALDPSHVAERAGISIAQYLALEQGTAWPGTEAVEAVIDALQIPDSHRACLAATGAPLDKYLQRMLHGYDIPALIVDSTWRTVEANAFARTLLPDSALPGWNLMRWVLLDDDARRRLANWDDVARCFSGALRDAITAAPHNAELLAIREDATQLGQTAGPSSRNCPDAQVFVWRTDSGAYPISACLVTSPSGRPDLQQVTFVPRSTQPVPVLMAAQASPAPWYGPLLTDLLSCGLCGLLLTGGGRPTTYGCATGCLPELSADDLELRIAKEVLTRAFPAQACRELGIAQEILMADGIELELNVPVSPQHALDQWQRSMTNTQRRGILTSTLRSATVNPAPGTDGSPGIDLAYNWRELTHP
ncbi:helix-turn-helix transcriptional regulator [Streptomyces sp. NBC_01142]|uniref:helix-turn-helix transcriptional regulator n=1 Tax=Streptomyces sp. NBC_01142 TaxID=2975865 RepID=UPI00225998F0|nr:helix-turn-helix transcriptional regulator [Streptomyces sp. NBC_01142]MCX4826866.1 helix-turn-helix transcriptional regulator [Streptomyces sp. NBC_01142]